MSQPLPTGSFRWVDDEAGLAKTIADHPADSREELHKKHNAYPLAPERMVVQKEWMSEYQHDLIGAGAEGRKAGPEPPQQEPLCAPLPQSAALPVSGPPPKKDPPSSGI